MPYTIFICTDDDVLILHELLITKERMNTKFFYCKNAFETELFVIGPPEFNHVYGARLSALMA